MAAEDTVVVHPNRERPEAKSTKAAVALLLLASAGLSFLILVGGWTRIPGQKPFTVVCIAVFVIMAYYVWHWSRGTLAMAAGLGTIFLMAVVVALPGWFSRDKDGFDDPLLPAGLLGLLTLVLLFVVVAVIVTAMIGFNQRWNVEVEVSREEAEEGIDPDKYDITGADTSEEDEESGGGDEESGDEDESEDDEDSGGSDDRG
jgi:hypothetical protein